MRELVSILPLSSISIASKASSTSLAENLSPQVMRACLNLQKRDQSTKPCPEACVPFAVDGAVLVERPESSDDDFVVIGAAGVLHAVAEQAQQLGEVDRSRGLVDHLVELLLVGEFAHGVEGRPKIGLADDAVLVVVHQLEAFLELSYLRLGEHGEDIGTRALGLLRRALGRGSGFGGWSRGGCSFRWRFFLLLLLNLLFFVRLEKDSTLNLAPHQI
jgi:hypothetical protein